MVPTADAAGVGADSMAEPSSPPVSANAISITTTTTVAPTTTTTIVDTAPDGFVTARVPDVGFSIALPEDYRVVDLSQDELDELLEEDLFDNELLNVAVESVIGAGDAFILWAFDFANGSIMFVPNLNVIRTERTPFDEIDIMLDLIDTIYETSGGEAILAEEFDTDLGDAVYAEAFFDFGDGTGSYAVQLVLLTDDHVYSITFSFLNSIGDEQRDAVLTSLASITVED